MAVDPRDPRANWGPVRRIVVFCLGVATVIDAVVMKGDQIGQLLTGALLLGIIPVDQLLEAIGRRYARPAVQPMTRVEIVNGNGDDHDKT